ncbi:PAS domain-containing protein, partial [Streptomyces sp. SID625]|nr:PAS domain-containing protein [Streptomyces sp. SID625]
PPDGGRWSGVLTLRHRDGHTVSVWVLAHRRRPQEGGGWLAVTPLADAVPGEPDEDPLSGAGLVQSPCAVALYDDRLRLRAVNDAMAEVLGVSGDRLRGLRHSEIGAGPQSADIERRMLQVLDTGRPHDVRAYVPVGGDGRTSAWMA